MTGTDIAKLSISAQLLLDYADYSPNEIEEKTGIPAVEAAQKLLELLSDRDWLTIKQREQVLLHRLEDVVRDSQDMLKRVSEDNYAATLNAVLRGFESIAKRLDAQRKNIDIDITEITRAQARTFGSAYDYAWDVGVEILREQYGLEIDDAELIRVKIESMNAANRKLRESTSE